MRNCVFVEQEKKDDLEQPTSSVLQSNILFLLSTDYKENNNIIIVKYKQNNSNIGSRKEYTSLIFNNKKYQIRKELSDICNKTLKGNVHIYGSLNNIESFLSNKSKLMGYSTSKEFVNCETITILKFYVK